MSKKKPSTIAIQWLKDHPPIDKDKLQNPEERLQWYVAYTEAETIFECRIKNLAEYLLVGIPKITVPKAKEIFDSAWEDEDPLTEAELTQEVEKMISDFYGEEEI